MTDAPPPPEAPAPPPASPPPGAPSARSLPLPLPAILIIAAILVIGVIAFVATHTSSSGPTQAAYTVQPYTPPSELITAGDRVIAHAAPDAASPAVVMFGQGVTLAVNGRVSRGLGSDWYAIAWNGHPAFVRQQDGTHKKVREMGEGSFFGEISVLSGKARTASVTAMTSVEALVLELFSPVPAWARRRWDAIGEPVPKSGSLFAYRVAKAEIEEERRFARDALWLEELTTDSR